MHTSGLMVPPGLVTLRLCSRLSPTKGNVSAGGPGEQSVGSSYFPLSDGRTEQGLSICCETSCKQELGIASTTEIGLVREWALFSRGSRRGVVCFLPLLWHVCQLVSGVVCLGGEVGTCCLWSLSS